jgi:hypothetical protein
MMGGADDRLGNPLVASGPIGSNAGGPRREPIFYLWTTTAADGNKAVSACDGFVKVSARSTIPGHEGAFNSNKEEFIYSADTVNKAIIRTTVDLTKGNAYEDRRIEW